MIEWLQSHSLYWLLAIAAIFTFDWIMQKRERLGLKKWYVALALALLHVVYGVLTVKVFAVAEAGFNFEKAGSMSLFGAVFLMPLAYYLGAKLTKRSVADVFDIFSVTMIFTLLCARVNCLFAGCCLGSIIPGTDVRFPTREAELLFYAVFLVIMIPRVHRDRGQGRVYPIYMIAYGAFRAVTECFRESNNWQGIFHISHVWALISIVLGTIIYIIMRKRQRTSEAKKHTKKS